MNLLFLGDMVAWWRADNMVKSRLCQLYILLVTGHAIHVSKQNMDLHLVFV